jgi:hypothetical protein
MRVLAAAEDEDGVAAAEAADASLALFSAALVRFSSSCAFNTASRPCGRQ